MGLIYNPNESRELVSNFNANITACEQIISDLKTGNSHLVFALNSKLLSGAAFNAGLSMFSQLVNPTVDKVDTSIQELKTKLQQYTQYTDAAGSEILDEDKLNEQLDELNRQQAMVSSQIRFYQNQARLNDSPELTAMCYNHASELNSYMSTIYEDIRKVEERLKKLHELDMKIASLFSDAQNEIQNLSTGILAINSVSIDSLGNFSIECDVKDLARIKKFLSDKGSDPEELKNLMKELDLDSEGIPDDSAKVLQKVLEAWLKKKAKSEMKDYMKTLSEYEKFYPEIGKYLQNMEMLLKLDKYIGYSKVLTNVRDKYKETDDIYIAMEYAIVSFSFRTIPSPIPANILQDLIDASYKNGSWNQQFNEGMEKRKEIYQEYEMPKWPSDQILDNMWGK